MLDALVEACRLLQTTEVLPESHGAVPRVTLTMDYTQLQELSGFATTTPGQFEFVAPKIRALEPRPCRPHICTSERIAACRWRSPLNSDTPSDSQPGPTVARVWGRV